MKHLGRTPPFLDRTGAPLTGSIAEVGYRKLGGLDQWVMIRGVSVDNPPLIMLHGGPGLSETALFRHFNSALEQRFTVVYWDQRGTGKSFARSIPPETMTVERFIGDLDELVNAIRVRLGHSTVAIFGHSWGAALGVLYAARFPEKVAAYVGSGQIGDWAAGEAAPYAFALAEARRVGDGKSIGKLRRIGPPPYSAKAVFTERTCLARLEGLMTWRTLWSMARITVEGPEASLADVPNQLRGFGWSLDRMWPEVSRMNLLRLAPALRMPVFFFLGRRDHWVPPETGVAYFDALIAPSKRLLWFEQSGHEPFADEADRFNGAMIELVHPAVVARRSAPAVAATDPCDAGAARTEVAGSEV